MSSFLLFDVTTKVFTHPSRTENLGGIFNSLSITTRMGFFPVQSRTVREGLSSNTVFVPIRMAISSLRILWANWRENLLVIHTGLVSVLVSFFGAINPSPVCAHFRNI